MRSRATFFLLACAILAIGLTFTEDARARASRPSGNDVTLHDFIDNAVPAPAVERSADEQLQSIDVQPGMTLTIRITISDGCSIDTGTDACVLHQDRENKRRAADNPRNSSSSCSCLECLCGYNGDSNRFGGAVNERTGKARWDGDRRAIDAIARLSP